MKLSYQLTLMKRVDETFPSIRGFLNAWNIVERSWRAFSFEFFLIFARQRGLFDFETGSAIVLGISARGFVILKSKAGGSQKNSN